MRTNGEGRKPSNGCRKELLHEKLIFPPVLLCHIGTSKIIIFINLLKRLLIITKSITLHFE